MRIGKLFQEILEQRNGFAEHRKVGFVRQQRIVEHGGFAYLRIEIIARRRFESHLRLLFLIEFQVGLSDLQLCVLIKCISFAGRSLEHLYRFVQFSGFHVRKPHEIGIAAKRIIGLGKIIFVIRNGARCTPLTVMAVAQHPIHFGGVRAARIGVQERLCKPYGFIQPVIEESGLSGIKSHLFSKFGMVAQAIEPA